MSRLEIPLFERKLQSAGDMLLHAELALEIKTYQGTWRKPGRRDVIRSISESAANRSFSGLTPEPPPSPRRRRFCDRRHLAPQENLTSSAAVAPPEGLAEGGDAERIEEWI